MAIADLEMLLGTDGMRVMPGGRLISDLFKDCIAMLCQREDFVVSGKLARSVYAQAQFTSNFAFLAQSERRAELTACFTAIGLVVSAEQDHRVLLEDPASRACIELRFARTDLEYCALDAPAHHVLFGSRVRFIAGEHLLWLLCRSDELDDYVTAEALLLGGLLDVAGAKKMMTEAADQLALNRLGKWLVAADQAKGSTYNTTMQRRLAQRSPGPRPVPVWRLGLGKDSLL